MEAFERLVETGILQYVITTISLPLLELLFFLSAILFLLNYFSAGM